MNDQANTLSDNLLHTALLKEFGFVNDSVLAFYKKAVSVHQSCVSNNGKALENFCEKILRDNDIPFSSQVVINHKGVIILNCKKNVKKLHHVLDIVVGDVKDGDSIQNYVVISCKTTCRERWTQDEQWSKTNRPKKYVLATTSQDYPNSQRFMEAEDRVIVTSKPKTKDDRKYPLSFDDLVLILR